MPDAIIGRLTMTRAEIRRQRREEEKDNAILHLTRRQVGKIAAAAVEKHGEEVAEKIVEENFIVMLGLSCWALRDTFGFGKGRLDRFMDNVLTKYECMLEDHDMKRRNGYGFDMAIKLLKEEAGFDLESILRKRRVIK